MAREYFCCYHSYLEAMEQLNDTERGRLFTACLIYSKTGEAPELRGNERFVFPAFRSQIDRDNASYEEMCRKQSENIKKRWNKTAEKAIPPNTAVYQRIPNDTNDTNTKEKEKEKEKAKTKENLKGGFPPTPPCTQAEGELARLPIALREVMAQWLEYKAQRREAYKPAGLTALVSETLNNVGQYGESAVAQVIRTSMASGYKGIVFDRLRQSGWQKTAAPVGGQPSQWAVDAVSRMMEQETSRE